MTSNFRVLTANIFFYFRLHLGQDIYYQLGEGVHSEREREREVGGAGGGGGGGGGVCALDDLLVYCRGMGGGGDIFC